LIFKKKQQGHIKYQSWISCVIYVAKSLGGAAEGMHSGCNFPLNMPLPVRGIVAVADLFGMVAGRTSSGW